MVRKVMDILRQWPTGDQRIQTFYAWMTLSVQHTHWELVLWRRVHVLAFSTWWQAVAGHPGSPLEYGFSWQLFSTFLLLSLKDQVLLQVLWRPQSFSGFNVSYPQGNRKTRAGRAKGFRLPRLSGAHTFLQFQVNGVSASHGQCSLKELSAN